MKIYKISASFTCIWLLLIGKPIPAQAQTPASSFEELRSQPKLRQGESIEITDDTGKKFKARLAEISVRSIGVIVDGVRRDLQESTVREIQHRRRDVWWNGMLMGLGAGAATGAFITSSACDNDPECAFYVGIVSVPLSAGIGAGVGSLIDFAIRKHETVFVRAGAASRRLSISPILSKDRTGVRLAFSF